MSGSAFYMNFQQIVDVIGPEAAAILVRDFGGTRFYVPEKIEAGHKIADAIGVADAVKFAKHIATGVGGMVIEIPSGASTALTESRARLREMVEKSTLSEREIAARMNVHGRTVRRMRALIRRERQQANALGALPTP